MCRHRLTGTAVAASLLLLLLPFAVPTTVVAADGDTDAEVADLPIFTYESILVTASRYGDEAHLSHSNLPTNEIRRIQSAVDIPILLEDIPGVYSYSDAGNGIGYTYLKIRGFDQRRVAVLVNGIPLNDPEDHQVYWVDMPDLASSVEDVQVQRGITNGVGGVTAIGGQREPRHECA